jgi:hypothetical protein
MTETLWVTPVPPSALSLEGFQSLGKRQCELSFMVEDPAGGEKRTGLIFEGVEAYKCTHLTSLTLAMIRTAYGKLVRLGETQWLEEVSEISGRFYNISKQLPRELQHLMICFDDGPCYEIICVSFKPF